MKEKYFWTGIGVVILIGLASFFIVRFFSGEESVSQAIMPVEKRGQTASDSDVVESGSSAGQVTKIKSLDEASMAVVRYSADGFSPKKLTLRQNAEGLGCFVKIINVGDSPLSIHLSPHSISDVRGFLYGPILSNDSLMIDPRYRIDKIAFHNHEKPDDEFSVELSEGCKLE